MSKETVYNKLKELGYSKEATAGIMANIEVETGGTFDAHQKQDVGKGKVGKGKGLFQMEVGNALTTAYADFLTDNKKTDGAEAQIEFMHETVYGAYKSVIGEGHAKKLRQSFASGDAEDVTKEFMERWERPSKPHTERRVAAAESLLDYVPDPIEEAVKQVKPQGVLVNRGDTLSSIARNTGVDINTLVQLNGITDPNMLMVGQQLKTQ